MSVSTPRAGPSRPAAPRRTSTLKGSSPASSPVVSPAPTPTRKQSAVSSVADRKARREQLRNFYGIKDDASNGAASPGKGPKALGRKTKKPDRNPNEGGFDAEAYYDELVQKATLAELMNATTTIAAEVNNLLGSRHSLVYNHHHQLFAAGDTISVLNSRTPQLLSIVTSLQDSFSSISQLADSIALPDEPEVLVNPVERGVQRLRLMVVAKESPERIRQCYESFRAALEKAVEVDKPQARELQAECERLLAGLLAAAEKSDVEAKHTT